MAKCGEIVVWHWSHYPDTWCSDTWAEESEWHLGWKEWALSIGWQVEVPIVKEGRTHRADILTSKGWVIELQHSGLDVREIEQRERFYGRMVWLWDVRDAYDRFVLNDHDWGVGIRWKQPRWSLCEIKRPLYLDFDDGDLMRVTLRRKPSLYYDRDVCLGRGQWCTELTLVEAFGSPQTMLPAR